MTQGGENLLLNISHDKPDDFRRKRNRPKEETIEELDRPKRKKKEEVKETDQEEKGTSSGGFGSSFISSIFDKNPEIPQVIQKNIIPIKEAVFSKNTFQDLDLHPYLISNLKNQLGLETLTLIQQQAIPHVLNGKNVLVKSQTGSGKTLVYLLPILNTLQATQPKISREQGFYAIIIVPTRELALQTYDWLLKLCPSFAWIVPGLLMGGEKRKSEKARIRRGINILVTTPGRLLDHIENTHNISFARVRWLVLDEADRLMDMGYEKDVSSIVSALNGEHTSQRQTVLLSATLTPAVERLAGLTLADPVFVEASSCSNTSAMKDSSMPSVTPSSLRHFYVIVPAKLRLVTLASIILSKLQNPEEGKVLVFMATQDMVDYHLELFIRILQPQGLLEDEEANGLVKILKLHGNMTQKDRSAVFKEFREASAGVLLSTDVAARGLDLPKVNWIIQYNPCSSVSDYVHRVGRTARVGQRGSALVFLTPSETDYIKLLEDTLIRLEGMPMEDILSNLLTVSNNEICRGRTMEERATDLQLHFENAILQDKELHNLGVKGCVSFIRSYASYPNSVREVLCFKKLHLGHVAKSFALRDTPSELGLKSRWQGNKAREKVASKREERVRWKKTFSTRVKDGHRLPQNMTQVCEYSSGLSGIRLSEKNPSAKPRKQAKNLKVKSHILIKGKKRNR